MTMAFPAIAEAFHRTGAVEIWGRGTNRVIAACKDYGIAPPTFEERQGFLLVTFKAKLATGEVTPQVTPQVAAVLAAAIRDTKSREEIQKIAGIKDREHFRKACLLPLLSAGWLERTIPEKPRSRLQRYRTTPLGKAALGKEGAK